MDSVLCDFGRYGYEGNEQFGRNDNFVLLGQKQSDYRLDNAHHSEAKKFKSGALL